MQPADVARSLGASNRHSRLDILKDICIKSAIGLRVAVGQAADCPWPLVARKYYICNVECKIAYLLPLVVGVGLAGARITGLQARWALAVITGQTTWPKTLKVPSALRRQLCADLGWSCLWSQAKAAAISLFQACQNDDPCFVRTQLSNDVENFAPGGWLACTHGLLQALGVPAWKPDAFMTAVERKRSLANYRKAIVLPKLSALLTPNRQGPLPWAWLAASEGRLFERESFDTWWQLRCLGLPYPRRGCAWCSFETLCTRAHLEQECPFFARACALQGIRTECIFRFPANELVDSPPS